MPRRETRKNLVESTARLLVTRGFHATGMNQVLAESGAPRGSLYFHFPGGKLELAVEAVHALGDELAAELGAILDGQRTLEAGLRALCGMFAVQLQKTGFQRGCPIATVSLEAGAGPPALLEACADVFRRWEGELATRLQAEGLTRMTARSTAANVLALIEGALLLAKAHHDAAPLRRAGEAAAVLIRAARPRG
jgi:TetR/AcrR family transcriptional repressor of lmrAB and yxaGH operons